MRNAGGVIYCYDQNGNVVKRGGLTQTWASFDLPTSLQATVNGSTYQSQFFYGPDHKRWKQIGTYSNGTETTLYVGGLLEKVTSTYTGLTYWRHYVPTPSGLTAIVSRNSNNSTWTTFALSDHLGSGDALLDGTTGEYKVRESFDAYGARRGSNWSASTPPDWVGIADTTRRGFTFHEMLDNIGLIHMNARVYDPVIGRFLSADPIIPSLADSQSVNSYSYVGNRPFSHTDPTGLYPDGCGGVCAAVISSAVKTALNFLFGSSKSLPPPATSILGTSAQNGVNICDPGMSSPSCGGGLPGIGLNSLRAASQDIGGVPNVLAGSSYHRVGQLITLLGQQSNLRFEVDPNSIKPPVDVYEETPHLFRALRLAVIDLVRDAQLMPNEKRIRRLEDAKSLINQNFVDTSDPLDIRELDEVVQFLQDAIDDVDRADPDARERGDALDGLDRPGFETFRPTKEKGDFRFEVRYRCAVEAQC